VAGADVIVIGAGIAGLSTAILLQEAGPRVLLMSDRSWRESTSYLAAAVWFPTRVGPRERVRAWGEQTYTVLREQAERRVPGVLMRESLFLAREPIAEPWWASAVGKVRPALGNELPPGYAHGLRFTVPLVEMPQYLPWLLKRFSQAGGEVRWQHVHSISEVASEASVVVNCTGLAARELVGDRTVVPVRGQIVRVSNPGLTISVRDEDHPDGRAYVHPRSHDCILGGTLEEGNWDTSVDLVQSESIIARCRDLAPQLLQAKVLEHIVGLRPGRPTVRVEQEIEALRAWRDTVVRRLLFVRCWL